MLIHSEKLILFRVLFAKVRTHAFRKAHENIDNTLKSAESVLTEFDVSRQVLDSLWKNEIIKVLEHMIGNYGEVRFSTLRWNAGGEPDS